MIRLRQHELDLRISSMPTVYGEKMVLRLLDKSRRHISWRIRPHRRGPEIQRPAEKHQRRGAAGGPHRLR